ncbi:non-ribosomal peptide synthetase [Enhygromyxa salina]|uniref:Linear gramicidin synthase subunit D n=1 Tax=Enhygromyxa salina TaxID=215803 RepID=A0A2S9Y648_9BACT|nr:amino acid adenylation domain-containing protein [Enhygromyxa salina]PRQ00481.1 Linear gramicidin synthase subunit D [Enhygromyxa salina]
MSFSLHHLITRAAQRDPEAPALVAGARVVSYGALAQRINAIATVLVQLGVRRGDRVGLYMRRSVDSVAAIFAISQAGGAYVGFDPSAPPARVAAVIDDAELDCVLVDEHHHEALLAALEHSDRRLAVVGGPTGHAQIDTTPWSAVDQHDTPETPLVELGVMEQDLCVLFYTSGTTGKPKGVAHDHRSMLSNVEWAVAQFDLRRDDRFAHVTSHHFDLSWFELFVSVFVGGVLVLVPERLVAFPGELAELVIAAEVSVWCSVPAVLIGLVQRGELEARSFPALRRVHFAGERFPTKHLRALMAAVPGPRYCNMFGTTETHIAAFHEIDELPPGDEWLPIGRACAHVNLMAVDRNNDAVDVGGTGELLIRGPSMMEGYWRLPDRTAQAIVELPVPGSARQARWYRSGDLVVRLADGGFQIVGRADRRVKVRGYLVDLDEVEQVLLNDSRVIEAATHVHEEGELSAHVEAAVRLRAGVSATSASLRMHVAQSMPTYAVPELVAILDEFPRTGHGKFDRRGLVAEVAKLRSARRQRAGGAEPRDAVRAFIAELVGGSLDELDDDGALIDGGWIDSMDIVELVAFLEERFDVQISNDAFVIENFETVAAIVRMIDSMTER